MLKFIVSDCVLAFALNIACRKLLVPLSFVLATVNVAAFAPEIAEIISKVTIIEDARL